MSQQFTSNSTLNLVYVYITATVLPSYLTVLFLMKFHRSGERLGPLFCSLCIGIKCPKLTDLWVKYGILLCNEVRFWNPQLSEIWREHCNHKLPFYCWLNLSFIIQSSYKLCIYEIITLLLPVLVVKEPSSGILFPSSFSAYTLTSHCLPSVRW